MKVLASMLCGVDITEIYSPMRVNAVCSKYGLIPGDSFDLRNGYDLSDEKVQAQVIRRIRDTEPRLIIGSPPCTLFSRLQALNIAVHGPEWEKTFLVEREKAVKHLVLHQDIPSADGCRQVFPHGAPGVRGLVENSRDGKFNGDGRC